MYRTIVFNAKIYCFALILLGMKCILSQTSETAPSTQNSYFNSLKNGGSSEVKILKNAYYSTSGTKGLYLTNANLTQWGAAFFPEIQLNRVQGIEVSFDYKMYGGTNAYGSYGDGLSFFLYDADKYASSPVDSDLGVKGGGLGYTWSRAGSVYTPGLKGAYLAVGLDEFGNFKKYRTNDGAWDGIADSYYPTGSGDVYHSNVTLRGAGDADEGTARKKGYPVLYTRATKTNVSSAKLCYTLNSTTGDYDLVTTPLSNTFSIRQQNNISETRKVTLRIIPYYDNSPVLPDGYYVDVFVTYKNAGMTTANTVKVVDRFLYRDNTRYYSNTRVEYDNLDNSVGFNNLAVGLSASTGAASQYHLIQNFRYQLAYAADATDDVIDACSGSSTVINVMANDEGAYSYNGSYATNVEPTQSNTYIDYDQFSFTKSLDINSYDVNNKHSYTDARGNQWSYDKTTGLVTFTPGSNFSTDGTASVTYSIKGYTETNGFGSVVQPFGQAEYRSSQATITVNLITTGCEKCYKPSTATGTPKASYTGITTIDANATDSSGEWLTDNYNNGALVLESNTKGLVIPRVQTTDLSSISAAKGMIVYDTDANCIKLYNGSSWGCIQQHCE